MYVAPTSITFVLKKYYSFIIIICRHIKSERATIHKNLVFALGVADVIFLVTVAVKPDGVMSTLCF